MAEWVLKIDIKPFLSSDIGPEAARVAAGKIASVLSGRREALERLERGSAYKGLDVDAIIEQFEDMSSPGSDASTNGLNWILEDLYDWADHHRLWLGP